ncbi:antibiotic biosynthesis monooxygenase [Apilactobacillus micheneri]|uniref:putative quinol monooxygenase n=1 Tax=Apilactobacillus micheneri TaxID=1899430 RepID=UPI0011297CAB|nr:putative quinol monooxygenase [Apilactobacillus micheneri]TPR41948.1 antibiotic biosynthesis monooxygenase [Apilactobacillus micheneri]TPR46624.1 antibiotic biosynthesis monooxygenase [Apilactobacillus micheneri]
MITNNVRLTIDSNKRAEYLSFIDDLVNKSLKDKGNLLYAHYQDINDENQYLILEHWENQAALDAYSKTDHLLNFKNHIGEYVTKKPEIVVFKN